MKWMIFISAVFVTSSLAPANAQPPMAGPSGTCASIGYSDSCCPRDLPREACRAASPGNCFCSQDCYLSHRDDCCMDVACARSNISMHVHRY
jgi:hypothetical protein